MPLPDFAAEGLFAIKRVGLRVEEVQHLQEAPLIVQRGGRRQEQDPLHARGRLGEPRIDLTSRRRLRRGEMVRLIDDQHARRRKATRQASLILVG